MADEFTAKFKVDISDLKKNIDQAQKEIKKADATFKASTAGMDKWAKDADGLSAKLTALDKTLGAQKSILSAYKDELGRNRDAYDQNKKRADELRKKLQELADSGVSKSSEEYKKYKAELVDTEKEMAKNEKTAENLEIQILNQEAAVKDTEKQMRHYKDGLEKLGKEEDEATDDAKDLGTAVKKAGDDAEKGTGGFTVLKGALADLVADGIKAALGALKDLAKGVYDSWKSYDAGADAIIKKTGAVGKQADDLKEAYSNLTKSVLGDFEDIGNAVGEVSTRFGATGKDLEDLTTQFIKFADINGTDVTSSIDSAQAAMAAWGIESKDTSKYLDMVTKASQDTGTGVEEINTALLNNSTAFQEMGYSIEDATFFMAGLEKSGADTNTVLTGMKKALQKATKEGKPLSDVMGELEEEIKNAKTQQEAMSKASEIFGTKAGPALATAIRDGRVSFQDLGKTMEEFQGTVETTYDATLDGPDKIQLALQNLKSAAAETFGEFMDKHGPEVTEFVQKFIKEYLPVIIQLLDKTFKAIETVLKIAKTWAQIFKDIGTATKAEVERIHGFFVNLGEKIRSVWESIKGAAKTAVSNISGFFSVLWTGLKSGATSAWENVKKAFANIGPFFSGIWDRVKNTFSALGTKIGDAIGGAVKTGINGVISRIEKIVNTAIGAINGAIGLINMIPGVRVGKIGSLSLPRLAQGGVLKKGQVGLLEGSGAEAVVPLEKNKKWISAVAADMTREITGGSSIINRALTNNNTTTYTQIINAPKAPSRIELYRQTRNLLAYTKGGLA